MTDNTSQLARFRDFVALVARKRELEAELRQVNEAVSEQKDTLFPMFEENPQLRVSVDGMTVYLTRRYAAKVREGVDRVQAAQVLSAWVPELVKPDFNLNTVSAFLRERIKEGGKDDIEAEMPPAVAECFEIRDWFDINAVSV